MRTVLCTAGIAQAAVDSVTGERRGPGDGLGLDSCALPHWGKHEGVVKGFQGLPGEAVKPL